MDEISLKKHIFYDASKDTLVGLEDLGTGISSGKMATSALVLMVRGIVHNWKQPLAYYLMSATSCHKSGFRNLFTRRSFDIYPAT